MTLLVGGHEEYWNKLYDAQNCFKRILPYLDSSHESNQMFLTGSWEQLNKSRSQYRQATCAINNYIIALINAKEYKLSLYCNKKIEPYNLKFGRYFDSKINLAREEFKLHSN